MLYQVCDNKYLREVMRMVEGVDHRNRVYKSNEAQVHEGISEHLDIVERMLAKDYEGGVEMPVQPYQEREKLCNEEVYRLIWDKTL